MLHRQILYYLGQQKVKNSEEHTSSRWLSSIIYMCMHRGREKSENQHYSLLHERVAADFTPAAHVFKHDFQLWMQTVGSQLSPHHLQTVLSSRITWTEAMTLHRQLVSLFELRD